MIEHTKKIYTLPIGTDENFVGMKLKLEPAGEKILNQEQLIFFERSFWKDQYKIIAVAEVVSCFKMMLGKLIEFIEIDIRKQLAGHVTQWQTFRKAVQNKLDEPPCIRIVHAPR